MTEQPVFEAFEASTGSHIKIWANGRTEGLPPNVVIINRIPQLVERDRFENSKSWAK